jgi:hypothetical protein
MDYLGVCKDDFLPAVLLLEKIVDSFPLGPAGYEVEVAFPVLAYIFSGIIGLLEAELEIHGGKAAVLQTGFDNLRDRFVKKHLIVMGQRQAEEAGDNAGAIKNVFIDGMELLEVEGDAGIDHPLPLPPQEGYLGGVSYYFGNINVVPAGNKEEVEVVTGGKSIFTLKTDHSEGVRREVVRLEGKNLLCQAIHTYTSPAG